MTIVLYIRIIFFHCLNPAKTRVTTRLHDFKLNIGVHFFTKKLYLIVFDNMSDSKCDVSTIQCCWIVCVLLHSNTITKQLWCNTTYTLWNNIENKYSEKVSRLRLYKMTGLKYYVKIKHYWRSKTMQTNIKVLSHFGAWKYKCKAYSKSDKMRI